MLAKRNRLKILTLTTGFSALLSIGFLVFWFFYRPHFAWSLHKEIVYQNILDKLIEPTDSDAEKVSKVFNFVRNHEYVFPGYSTLSQHPIDNLIRGIGWCSQQSFTFVTLLHRLGIPAHLIYLYKKNLDISNHSVSEAFVNGKWVLHDPLFSFIPKDSKTNQLLSPDEVIKLVSSGQQERVLNAIQHATPIYLGYYTGRAEVMPRNSSKPDKYLRLSRFLVRFFSLDKPWPTSVIQNAYFHFHLNENTPRTHYQRAKLLYFTGRYRDASSQFQELVQTEHVKYQDSLLWGGVNEIENNHPEKAIEYFNSLSKYREEKKPSRQVPEEVLSFFRAKAYKKMGDMENAQKWIKKADYQTASNTF